MRSHRYPKQPITKAPPAPRYDVDVITLCSDPLEYEYGGWLHARSGPVYVKIDGHCDSPAGKCGDTFMQLVDDHLWCMVVTHVARLSTGVLQFRAKSTGLPIRDKPTGWQQWQQPVTCRNA